MITGKLVMYFQGLLFKVEFFTFCGIENHLDFVKLLRIITGKCYLTLTVPFLKMMLMCLLDTMKQYQS